MDIEIAIALSIFTFFIALLIAYTVNYFSQLPAWSEIANYREKAISLMEEISSKGWPEKWEEEKTIPTQLGLAIDLYNKKIKVKENSGYNRIEEPVSLFISFDSYCENASWNNSV